MDDLLSLRQKIDQTDAQIVELFRQRMELTRQVGQFKLAHDIPVLDQKRETQVLEQKAELVEPELKSGVTALFETIMAISRRQQRQLMGGTEEQYAQLRQAMDCAREPLSQPRVLYQGEAGAYAQEAAAAFFGEETSMDHVPLWEDIFLALRRGEADYGVLPIENSSTGSINQVYDLLSRYGAYIIGEQTVRVNHCLMAPRGASLEGLKEVYSHQQGLLQCEDFLKEHPDWRREAMENTAAAAKFVSGTGDPSKAAIGSRRCAKLYQLEVLAENINFNSENDTRFVVVSPVMELREGRDKISALFTLGHKSGTLHRVLAVFAAAGLNLMKLESRPIPGRSWEYRFFVDFTGNLTSPGMEEILREAAAASETFRVLGNY